MKILLQMQQRLAEVVGIFPLARHLSLQKHEVFIECAESYRSALGLIDYAKWKDPKTPITLETPARIPSALTEEKAQLETMLLEVAGEDDKRRTEILGRLNAIRTKLGAVKPTTRALYDVVYPLAIWPNRAHEYRTENPPRRWLDFVTAPFGDDFKGAKREVIFTKIPALEEVRAKYRLPPVFSVACAAGFPQSVTHPVPFDLFEIWLFSTARKNVPVYYLVPPEWRPNRNHICVTDLAELATLIRGAQEFFTVNSGPAVIAGARLEKTPLRESWHHISPRVPRERFQDDSFHKGQVRWEVSATGSGDHIARQKDGRQ